MLIVACLAFLVSGFAALTYQVVWQRLFGVFSGSDVHSATIVVAAFMAGLGVGSLVGGRLADRLTARASVAAFVGAELAIALFGYFSTDFYYGVLYARLGEVALGPLSTAAVLFAGLLWPTFFMGLSLPLLTRGLASTLGMVARVAGVLYGLNTLGSATGAIAATWLMLPHLGLEQSVRIAAFLNVLVASLGAVVASRGGNGAQEHAPVSLGHGPSVRPAGPAFSYPALVAISGLSGFVALSFEIVWFRVLGVMLKSSAFTFGTLLAVYLSGIGLGAALISPWVHRFREPVRWFVGIQLAVAGYAAASLTLLVWGLRDAGALGWLFRQFGSYSPLSVGAVLGTSGPAAGWDAWHVAALYVGLPLWLVGIPTLLMGAAFPLLQQAIQRDPARVGTRLGVTLAGNIAGSTFGSLVTGVLCLTWLGAAGTLRLLVAIGALFPLLWVFGQGSAMNARPARLRRAAVVVLVAAALTGVMPGNGALWAPLHGAARDTVLVGEDASGIFALRPEAESPPSRYVVFANGIGQGSIPYNAFHAVLGALPAFIHEQPKDALVIGLGSAGTLFGIAGRPSAERVTCVEIVGAQLPTLELLSARRPGLGLAAVLTDPRITHVYGDGRTYVARSGRTFDIIEADALRPTCSYSGHLYSTEYFDLLRRHLRPGGLAVTWVPTDRTHRSFVKVFPYVMRLGQIALGSNEPIRVDPGAVRERLKDARVQRHFASAGLDMAALLAPYVDQPAVTFGPEFDRSTLTDLNTDLFPRDEFSGIRNLSASVMRVFAR